MGLVFVANNEDFSDIAVDTLGIATSITDGLLGLFETRKDSVTALRNRVKNGGKAVLEGSPTINTNDVTINKLNRVNTNVVSKTADRTCAVIMLNKPGTITTSYPYGTLGGSPTTQGAEQFNISNSGFSMSSILFDNGVYANVSSSTNIAKPSTSTYEMVVWRAKSGVHAKLECPRTGATTTVTTTYSFLNPVPQPYKIGVNIGTADINDNVAMFALWDRYLSDSEIATFYTEMKDYFADLGIII